MDRRQFLKTATATTFGMFAASQICCDKPDFKRPNFLVFMADDLGYSDLSCFGSKETQTPVLDSLAKAGIRFTDFYAGAPLCSPSRAAMLTGRFPTRVGMYSYVPLNSPMHLKTSEITSAKLLQQSGYDTAHMGKWHLGNDLQIGQIPTPKDHGFSYWFATENNALPTHHNPVNFVRNGKEVGKIDGYSCQIVADEAIGWLNEKRNANKPFFLNIWFHEPHRKVAAHRLTCLPDTRTAKMPPILLVLKIWPLQSVVL